VLELLVRLECKRQACRRRLLGHFTDLDRRYFGLAALIFFAFLPTIMAPALAAAATPPEAVVVGALIFAGCLLCATVIAAPIGLVFF